MKLLFLFLTLTFFTISYAQKGKKNQSNKTSEKETTINFNGLSLRCVGPAMNSGRIADIAVNPENHSEYYVAVASGGVWKTQNAGTTYRPIFDGQSSYSIGCIQLDPSNPHTVWVGTGENNNQRSVAYGDGVYKSIDGGKSWKNMGLKSSEHIGMIKVHPTNSNIVYVAAYGPLWSKGGDRGLYKTIDGGQKWDKILEIDEHTGISEVHFDPRNPDHLYAVSHQRRRHVFTYLGGGPGSGIHKSTDGGASWTRLKGGLPSGDYVGRIGLSVSPADPDYVYAIVEASRGKGGTYRSTDRGASWKKMSSYATSGNYYQEIIADLTDKNKVFSMNTWLHHTEDGGKTWKRTGEKNKHVDNHCIWIDPNDSNHWIVGCDGGIYETWNHAGDWQFKPNLPVTQFYKVAVDNATPFYNIYGGTQDNNSMGGPSRTTNVAGILNADWFITNGGDGFESQIDPTDPNIVYAQAQYGWLVRFDKKSGERVGIKPIADVDEDALRWNWDAPLLISPHNPKRLYFCANKVFRSENMGDDWTVISDDLSRQLDRNTLSVMDRVWSADAVMKNKSTSIFGNIVAFDESPLKEDLLVAGTDDGLIHVSSNGGESWEKLAPIQGVPEMTYVNAISFSKYDNQTMYAVFNNHKNGDFKPYIYKSTDLGETWTSVHGNLPERGTVYDIAEDHINKNLLFAGTEFGLFVTIDGGKNWQSLKSGLPTIAVKDIEIQERENDLVLATFGRGFYVLDDYSPIRNFNTEDKEKPLHMYPVKDGLVYMQRNPLGLRGKSSQGSMFYTADNPTYGVALTYWFGDTTMTTAKSERHKREAKLIKDGQSIPYPTIDQLHQEDWEKSPYLMASIKNAKGEVIRRMKATTKKGMNRIYWDFRHESMMPTSLKNRSAGRYSSLPSGALASPGTYSVVFHKIQSGNVTQIGEETTFKIKSLNNATLTAKDKLALEEFEVKLTKMRRAGRAIGSVLSDFDKRIQHLEKGILHSTTTSLNVLEEVEELRIQHKQLGIEMYGDNSLSSREFETVPSLTERMEKSIWNMWYATAAPSKSAYKRYEIAGDLFTAFLSNLATLEGRIIKLEERLSKDGAPYTNGSSLIPDWKKE